MDSGQLMSNHYQAARTTTVTTTGNIDDLDFGKAGLLRMNNATTATIRGLLAGWDGQLLLLVAIGAGQVDIADEDANSAAANRIITPTGATVTVTAAVGVAFLVYDTTSSRWRLMTST